MKKDSDVTQMNNYVNKKCKACGQIFEVRTDKADTLYGDYCAACFFNYLIEDIFGNVRLKTEEERKKNLDYKDELQDITHRGKTKVKK